MRSIALGLALAALATVPALAKDASSATDAGRNAMAQASTNDSARVLYVCDRSDLTRRGFAREFGSAEFVTADRAAKGEAWSAPRCISRPEMMRLKKIQSASLR
ncbi:hypothetical protein [Phenylobacterium sp.]|jgi:hypothetical protein|uniref:hypothetical protein n=1 Tax=Phenylobacterium sp. TaxID=1871053 RepID=UPI002E348A4C|nr:hypothetical protein [Phenylobacterium sp.]HEX2559040.1 hypothetical protein [Phenylobacterium sp.]